VIRGYDPRTGEERWSLGPNSYITIPTPVVGPDLVYVTGGYQPVRPIYAVRPGATGDISSGEDASGNEAVRWSTDRDGPYIPTPILYRDLLYTIQINGVLAAYDSSNGEEVYRARVGTGTFTASPVAADGRLYIANEEGRVFVVGAGSGYRELAVNEMGEMIMATPAISGGKMYLRTLNSIYAIGGE
jgi:outer membrane protein assembly factor BamB